MSVVLLLLVRAFVILLVVAAIWRLLRIIFGGRVTVRINTTRRGGRFQPDGRKVVDAEYEEVHDS
jgi:hypothetical protein